MDEASAQAAGAGVSPKSAAVFPAGRSDEDNIQIIGGAYLMKGLTPLEDITRTRGITLDDDFETLNGLLISKLEHIPQNNEFASVDIDGYTFKVMSVKDNAISLVKVTKITG